MSRIAKSLKDAIEKGKQAGTIIAEDVVNIYDDLSETFEDATEKLEEKTEEVKRTIKKTFNGKNIRTIVGGNVTIKNGELWVDGKKIDDSEEETENGVKIVYRDVVVEGGCKSVNTESGDVTVYGDCGRVNTMSGDATIEGDVDGDVKTMSGDVDVEGIISGSASTMSGDIKSRKCKAECGCS